MTFGASISSIKITVSAPPDTMPWVWSCHKCHTRYALGATRRCLHDGHYFCGGTTVDKITGRTKKHRACASEFDYIGWEDFGMWKRAQRQIQKPRFKHCEDQCDFPSACHWKARHAPKKTANFEFLDPKCLGTETKTTPKPDTSVKRTGLYINRLIKSAEKRTSQLTTLLSTMDEETNFASTPGCIPPLTNTSAPPKLPELNGLGLSFPVMDFSSLEKDPIDPHHTTNIPPPLIISPQSLPPPPSAIVSAVTEDDHLDVDIDMTDWISKPDSSPPTSPTSQPHPNRHVLAQEIPFDFSIATTTIDIDTDSSSSSLADDESSPVSPRKSAWQWTAGDIGIALSPPMKRVCDEIWDEQMEVAEEVDIESESESDETRPDMMGEKEKVNRSVSV
jgi:hypothetical protein